MSLASRGGSDDTTWLTYWSCFGLLIVFTEYAEKFLGSVPFFYTIMIGATLYLMLPMFDGANKIFRNVLVPLAGLEEFLVKRDAAELKRLTLSAIPPERRKMVLQSMSDTFKAGSDEASKQD